MYEKKVLKIAAGFCVNTCPHCGQQFVILAVWDDDDVLEQVGPTIYCYMCGKRFDEVKDEKEKRILGAI